MVHSAARCVGPHRAVADLVRQADHLVAQRRQDDGWQSTHRFGHLAHRLDVVPHVAERLAGVDAKALDHGTVGDPDAQPEPAFGDLVQVARRRRECHRVLEVDRLDRRAEFDRVGDVGDRQAQTHRITEARAVDAGEAPPFDVGDEFERLGTTAGNGGE